MPASESGEEFSQNSSWSETLDLQFNILWAFSLIVDAVHILTLPLKDQVLSWQ
jgi:hypothetical protein